jgi:hypothetical protein
VHLRQLAKKVRPFVRFWAFLGKGSKGSSKTRESNWQLRTEFVSKKKNTGAVFFSSLYLPAFCIALVKRLSALGSR